MGAGELWRIKFEVEFRGVGAVLLYWVYVC